MFTAAPLVIIWSHTSQRFATMPCTRVDWLKHTALFDRKTDIEGHPLF